MGGDYIELEIKKIHARTLNKSKEITHPWAMVESTKYMEAEGRTREPITRVC